MMKPTTIPAKMVPSRTPSRWPKNMNEITAAIVMIDMSKNGFTFPKSLFNTSAIARTAPSPGICRILSLMRIWMSNKNKK